MITIRHVFKEDGTSRNSSRFDPSAVSSVETRAEGSTQVIETVTSINNPSTGVYEAELDEDLYSLNTEYKAEWTYTVDSVQYEALDTWYKQEFGSAREKDAWVQYLLDALTDYVSAAPYVQDVLEFMGRELFEFKQVFNDDLYRARHVRIAEGDALTRFAEENGLQRREGETDASLRQRIILQQALYRAGGTIDDLQNLVIDLADAEGQNWDNTEFTIQELFGQGEDAYFYIEMDLNTLKAVGRDEVERLLDNGKSAGVSYQLRANGTFRLRSESDPVKDSPNDEGLTGLDAQGNKKQKGGVLSGINPR